MCIHTIFFVVRRVKHTLCIESVSIKGTKLIPFLSHAGISASNFQEEKSYWGQNLGSEMEEFRHVFQGLPTSKSTNRFMFLSVDSLSCV